MNWIWGAVANWMLVFGSFSAIAQTEFLMMPSGKDLEALSYVFEQSGKPLPVHIAYGFDEEDQYHLVMGVTLSEKIRNGIHARLMVSAGIAKNLADAKYGHPNMKAGTLFLERQDNQAVLSFHGRNSIRSTVNSNRPGTTASVLFPRKQLEEIAFLTGLSIRNSSRKLDETIRAENHKKYLMGVPEEDWDKVSNYHNLDNINFIEEIAGVPAQGSRLHSHPELVEEVLRQRSAKPLTCSQAADVH